MGGGAWPFLVGGVICLVNSDNERDLDRRFGRFGASRGETLAGPSATSGRKYEAITGL